MSGQLYDPTSIEAYWREQWASTGIYKTPEPGKKFYCLDFFPYPSGNGLSVGHGRNYVPTDVISRYHRMRGNAVLHPMGWDAFGLPAENEAVKKGIHPSVTTLRYAANYRRQMTLLGCSYDWEREINSSNPDYYRWTQWFFLLLYRRGLAYRDIGQQWWCPGCKTVLANEQVETGNICWRGHSGVQRRGLEQWFFRITEYAEALLEGLERLDWPEHILAMQRNWIGRSKGVEFEMAIEGMDGRLSVYTTRPDTVYGMTFAVLAPEHPLVARITSPERRGQVESYCRQALSRSEVDRLTAGRDGVFCGAFAINPVNGDRVPIYVADYVLMSYGTGAIMAVPAHDERDFDFAKRNDLPVKVVIAPPDWDGSPFREAYTGPGVVVNSGRWDNAPSQEAGIGIGDWFESIGAGRWVVRYRMRDWLISRQRYWGPPIPIVYCDTCGIVPVPEKDLPVLLPPLDDWQPGEDGRSPLANVPDFVHTTCPRCGAPARRETDTMDGFACSSWYFLRFVSPDFPQGPFDPEALKRWGAPDLYVGGAEHAVMHLLYARFWTKVMADAGLVPFDEPFPVLRSQGIMHARDPETGEVRRMSKSAGNVVTPDSMAEKYGADALRISLMFMAPFENNTVWDEENIKGTARYVQRVWRLIDSVCDAEAAADHPEAHKTLQRHMHRTIRSVTEQVEAFQFNTALADMMAFFNRMSQYYKRHGATGGLIEVCKVYLLLLAPFAPYIAEELWKRLGGPYSIHRQNWPSWTLSQVVEKTCEIAVQVDGRVRDRVVAAADASEEAIKAMALASSKVAKQLEGKQIRRVLVVPGRVVNVVTEMPD